MSVAMVSSLWKDDFANVIEVGPKTALHDHQHHRIEARTEKATTPCHHPLPIRATQAEQASWSDSSDQVRIHH